LTNQRQEEETAYMSMSLHTPAPASKPMPLPLPMPLPMPLPSFTPMLVDTDVGGDGEDSEDWYGFPSPSLSGS